MNTKINFLIFPIFLSLCLSSQAIVCPDPEDISPCTCDTSTFSCHGPSITQQVLDKAMAAIRAANNVGPQEWLDLPQYYGGLSVTATSMTQLDLTPFMWVRCRSLVLNLNTLLTTIVGPKHETNATFYDDTIETQIADFNDNHMTDEGMAGVLNYLSHRTVQELHLANNQLVGNSTVDSHGHPEFLPGLSRHFSLGYLYLNGNNIKSIEGGLFKHNNELHFLDFAWNQIDYIGEDSFLFNPPIDEEARMSLTLDGNLLTDASFHPNCGLSTIERPLHLHISNNLMDTISEVNFKTFVYAYHVNLIVIEGNRIICDARVKWIKDAVSILQSKIFFADCANDPGFDVFTSSLIDV